MTILLRVCTILLLSVQTAHASSDSWAVANASAVVCAEPMDNAAWALAGGTNWAWNPDDTSSGECADANIAGAALEVVGMPNVNPLVRDDSSSNATMFAALPAGHSTTYVWRSPISSASGSVGSDFMGSKLGAAPTGRIGIRFYRYYSSDYTFTNDPGGALCNSVKIIQGGYVGAGSGGPMIQAGEFTVYDVSTGTGWSSNVSIPDPAWGQSGIPSKSSMRGKWFRYELYISNNTTSGTSVIQAYGKNITDGTAEFTIIDTTGQAAMSGVHPNPALTDLHINGFRSNNGDPCNGYHANSHLVIAAWSSNSGQRIGAATEVEGNGATPGSQYNGGVRFSGSVRLIDLKESDPVEIAY